MTRYLYCSWAALKFFLNTAVRALHLKCQSFSLLGPNPPEALRTDKPVFSVGCQAQYDSGLWAPVPPTIKVSPALRASSQAPPEGLCKYIHPLSTPSPNGWWLLLHSFKCPLQCPWSATSREAHPGHTIYINRLTVCFPAHTQHERFHLVLTLFRMAPSPLPVE